MEKEVIPKMNIPTKPIKPQNTIKQPVNKSEKEVAVKPNVPVEKPEPNNVKKEIAQNPNTPVEKPKYRSIGNESIIQSIKKSLPDYLIPTKRLSTILGTIFLAVILLALVQLPYDEILSGNLEIKVGFPLTFLDFGIDAEEELPLLPLNLILDIIVYLILSYIIDVFISFMINANTVRIRKQEGTAPKVYVAPKTTIADKVVKKIILKK